MGVGSSVVHRDDGSSCSPCELVGRHVRRKFGSHGFYKGCIVSYDEDDELTFRVEYPDGDVEDL